MNRGWTMIAGAGLGAGLMYALDPKTGRRRRALMRDTLVRSTTQAEDAFEKTWRDARNRAIGLMSDWAALFGEGTVEDRRLVARVRSTLGTVVTHPSSIEVAARDGHVTLSGPILTDEADRLISAVRAIPGVMEIDNRLEAFAQAGDIPGLQGEPRRRRGPQPDILQRHWAPTTRAAAGAVGGGLALYALTRRNLPAFALATVGVALAARAALNRPFTELTGIGAGRRALEVQKTLTIAAPRDRVFAFFADQRNAPRISERIKSVDTKGDGRARWTLALPGGATVSWTNIVTREIPHEELAWKTEAGAAVQHAGLLRFDDAPDGRTTLHLRMSYNPPGGALGDAVASVAGLDLASLLEEELMRAKATLETGRAPQDAQDRSGIHA